MNYKYIIIGLGLILANGLVAQSLYTEKKVLSENSPLVFHSHKSLDIGLQTLKNAAGRNSDVSSEEKPSQAFVIGNTILTPIFKMNKADKREFYLAIVQPKEVNEKPKEWNTYLYYPAEDFEILADMPVDSAKMTFKIFRELYVSGFLTWLNDYEKREEEQLRNYYTGKFYVLKPDSIFFPINDLAADFQKEGLISSILPNADVYGSKQVKKTKISEGEPETVQDKEELKRQIKKEAMKEREEKKKQIKGEQAMDTNPDPEAKSKQLGLPESFLYKDNMALAQLVPFTKNGEAWIQKYMFTKDGDLIYSAQRSLSKRYNEAKWSAPDFSPFKTKPTEAELEGIKRGKTR